MAKSVLNALQKEFLDLFIWNKGLTKRFYLSGGTALTEFYLNHRISEDLDFFSLDEFSLIPIQAFLKDISPKLHCSKIEYRNFMGLHTFFIHGEKEILKVDFNYYPFPLIEKGKNYGNLSVDSLHDIAVNKLQTIATQPRSRDFIDLYFIIQETGWDINSLQKDARNKFDYFVDSLHLGSQFLQATELKDYPKMIKSLKEKEWQDFFLNEARKLKEEILL
jgi:predicted nucleotidyltransferase component of viral defense system